MMRLFSAPRLMIPALALLLAGCSGGNEAPVLELQVLKAGRDAIAERRGKPARPALTRAVLDTLEGSFLEATLERKDLLAYLYVDAKRRDGDPGLITAWRSEDNVTLILRSGVLIATRGLGGDILSSTVQVTDAPGPASGGEKVHYVRSLDNKALRLGMVCDLTDLGPETIEIIQRRHGTRHLRETCEGGVPGQEGRVVNDYWVDSRGGLIWQSRQWAGPHIGYLRLRRLTN